MLIKSKHKKCIHTHLKCISFRAKQQNSSLTDLVLNSKPRPWQAVALMPLLMMFCRPNLSSHPNGHHSHNVINNIFVLRIRNTHTHTHSTTFIHHGLAKFYLLNPNFTADNLLLSWLWFLLLLALLFSLLLLPFLLLLLLLSSRSV